MENNNIIEVYNRIAPIYFERREHMALLPEIELLCNLLPPNGRVLDAGCGNGRDSLLFTKRGYRVIGVDLSDGQLQYAYKRKNAGKIKFLKQDILQLDFPKEFFDGIWCCAVLPHFNKKEVLHVLRSFCRILVHSGYAIVTFKKGTGETYVEEPEFNGEKRFTTYLNENEIKVITEKSGFIIKKMYTYNEQKRFTNNDRNLDFIVALMQKN